MARSRSGSPMRNRWSAEEEQRSRHYQPYREKHKSEGRGRSPPPTRRTEPRPTSKVWIEDDIDSYRPAKRRNPSRDSYHSYSRRSSVSPKRPVRVGFPSHSRFEESRQHRSRDFSASRSPKRRRTRSPTPPRNGRPRYEHRGRSRSWSRSPTRGDSRDRRPVIDRAFSPRRSSPPRRTRAPSRGIEPEIDSYVPSRRRRTQSPSSSTRRRRQSSSPQRKSRTPPRKQKSGLQSPRSRRSPPYRSNTKVKQNAEPSHPVAQKKDHSSKTSSVADDQEPMDAQHPTRGNYGMHGNMTHGRSRPYQDNRPPYQGSPPMSASNSSYHGSPQSNASYHGGRGGWGGQQQYQSHHG